MYKGLQRKVMGIVGMEKWNKVFYALPTRDLQERLLDRVSGSRVRFAAGVTYDDGFSTLADRSVKLNLRLRLNVGMERCNSPHLVNGQCKCIYSRNNKQTKVVHNYTRSLSSKERNTHHYSKRNVLYRAAKKGMMAPKLEPQVELATGAMGRTDICLTDGLKVRAMHLDMVVVTPLLAKHTA